MRILWVKANKILPVHSGGDIRSFNILRQLAKQEEVTFLSYYDGPKDSHYEAGLREKLPGAISVSTGRVEGSTAARGFDYLLRLADPAPYAVSRFASARVKDALGRCLESPGPDVVVCDFLDAAVNFPDSLPVPSVLFQHNVESEIWRRHATNGSSGAKKLMYRMEFSKMLRYEQQMVKKFDHVIAVSDHDKKLMSAWVDAERITVVPTGVDTEEFSPAPPSGESLEENQLVIFVGAMDWEPNVDAVKYFCADIWPRVLARLPAGKFRIVGRNPDRRVLGLACDSVEITGRVPSVVEHLREARVVVVPVRIGGGTRLKIYEAMGVGKAVVSTTVGAEGLDVHHGKDMILADSPESFADSVVSLLTDEELRRRQGQAARELATKYGWPTIAKEFGEVLGKVARAGTSTRPALASQ
jgi:polysaccharide biosynthesis protein PslH